jgi:hypothetical protein
MTARQHSIRRRRGRCDPIIPYPPYTYERERRLRHQDVDALDVIDLRCERSIIADTLAVMRFWRCRPRLLVLAPGHITTDVAWLRERFQRLQAAEARQAARG